MVGIRTTNRSDTTEVPRRDREMDQASPSGHDPLTQQREPKALVGTREDCRPTRRHPEKGNPPPIPRPRNQRTSRMRPHHRDHPLTFLVAKHEQMDHTICERVCQMPTKQKPHKASEGTPLPNPHANRCPPVPNRGNGPDHPTPNQ
jgi:hypothetical protein